MLTVLMAIVVAILAAVLLAAWSMMGTNNRIVALDARCDTAFADVDVQLKHRHNLIPGLVETVKGFVGHERDLLMHVNQSRAEALNALSPDQRLTAEKKLTQNITALLNVANSYPQLQASGHFTALRQELIDCENRITAARRFFNLAVEEYNSTLRQFPGSLISARMRMSTRQVYDLGIERVLLDEPVAIQF